MSLSGRSQRRWRTLAGCLVALGMTFAATAAPPAAPVLLIGIDGLERRVVEAMWAEGYLPHLRALADRGVVLDLATAERTRERPLWTTVATGRPSSEHGIAQNTSQSSGKAAIGIGSDARQVKALWGIAHANGRTSHVADWPATWPAESVAGTILTDRAVTASGSQDASPPKIAASLERWVRKADTELSNLFPGSRDAAASDRLTVYATLQSLGADQADLTMLRLRHVDLRSHRLWKYFEPDAYPTAREPGWEFETREFYDAYVSVDAAVGQLVDAAHPESQVMVFSANGFKGIAEATSLKCTLAPVLQHLGYLALFDNEPEWRKTKLYVLDSPDSDPRKQVRVNLKGREPKGRVAADQKAALLAELTEALTAFQYAGTQTSTFRVESPREGEVGDVVVVFNEAGVGSDIEVGKTLITDAMLTFSRRSGGHGHDTPGLLIAAGPAWSSGPVEAPASVFDLAPTVLALLDIPVSGELTGRVLDPALDPAWLADHPVATVPSYEP